MIYYNIVLWLDKDNLRKAPYSESDETRGDDAWWTILPQIDGAELRLARPRCGSQPL